MKKVLIVAYHFPPDSQVGALRPFGLAKNLGRLGWEPIILTTRITGQAQDERRFRFSIVEAPPYDAFAFFRRLIPGRRAAGKAIDSTNADPRPSPHASTWRERLRHLFKAIFAFPDRHIGWYWTAVGVGKRTMVKEKIDLILSTSSPWTSAIVARRLSTKFHIPWVADFRDLWSQNHRYEFGRLRRFLDRRLEVWTLKRASCLVVVSNRRAEKWRLLHRRPIHAITLGYDEEVFTPPSPEARSDAAFTIVHAGKIKGKQDPEPLFAALSDLRADGGVAAIPIRVHIFGEVDPFVMPLIGRYGLEGVVSIRPRIPRLDLVRKMQQAALLLNFNWNDKMETGVHHGKLFDYLGVKRPILSIGKYHDVVTELLEATQAGNQFWEKDDLKRFLKERIAEFHSLGQVPYRGVASEVEKYGYATITSAFASLMNEAIGEN